MKILWFSHFIPYPPRGGSRQRSFNLLAQAARAHRVSLIAFNLESDPPDRLEQYRAALGEICESVTFWALPVRWRSPRWWLGLAASTLSPVAYTCSSFWSHRLRQAFEDELQQNRYDLVHFDSIDLALYASSAGHVPKVLNHHNCESAMAKRRSRLEANPLKRAYLAQQARMLAKMESRVCHGFEINTVVSESDAELLRRNNLQCKITVVENGTDVDYFAPIPDLEEPNTIVFAGGLSWYPNVSGLRFFVQQVWPLLKALVPDVRFIVTGRMPVETVTQLCASDAAITLVPDPEDIRPWIARGSAYVCPIIDGGGTRLKLLDAMAMGKATVSTSVGCEGLGVTDGRQLVIADRPDEFARASAHLLQDAELRLALAVSGRQFVENRYSWNSIGSRLREVYLRAESLKAVPQTYHK